MGGDFNCEFRSLDHSTWPLLCEFMRECDLSCTDHLISDDRCYTYFQQTTGATSHIDHFVISKNLFSCSQAVSIDDDGSNLSDHLPVTMICNLSLGSVNTDYAVSRSYLPESNNTAISCDVIKQTLYLIITDLMIYLLVLMLDV